MTVARCGVVVLVVLCVAGCGGSSENAKRRAAVNAYFDRVSQAEVTLQSQIGEIDKALQSFSLTKATPAELRSLLLARTRIRAGLGRVAAIHPPQDARRVHADLIGLLSLQEAVADELVRSAQFVPLFAKTGPPLVAAAKGLGRDLASVKPPAPTAAGSGLQLWTAAGCGSCHTLAATGSNGKVGPNLDRLRPSSAAVAAQVHNGGKAMPSYRKALSAAQITALASYVASAAGHPGAAAGAGAAAAAAPPDVYAQYASAFAHYRLALGPILTALDRLAAPPELHPILAAERRALNQSVSLCTEIEADLGKHDVTSANRAIQRLFVVASGVNSAQVAREQAAAARAYDARLTRIAALSAKLTRERQRLQTALQ
jgi:mono/diheme cytochrome c family protein